MTVRRLETVHRLRYFRFCNVLHIWTIRAIPTYRVYRLYDKGANLLCFSTLVELSFPQVEKKRRFTLLSGIMFVFYLQLPHMHLSNFPWTFYVHVHVPITHTTVSACPSFSCGPLRVMVLTSESEGGTSTHTPVVWRTSWRPCPLGPTMYLCWLFLTSTDTVP